MGTQLWDEIHVGEQQQPVMTSREFAAEEPLLREKVKKKLQLGTQKCKDKLDKLWQATEVTYKATQT